MDVSEYDCGIRQGESKKIKLGDSYAIAADSGYDSIYNGCASIYTEKSFSKESFDIFSPGSPSQTPSKHLSSSKYHVSTPKNHPSVKRHLYTSINSSPITKRVKPENNENDPKTVNTSISWIGQSHESSSPLGALNNFGLQENYLFNVAAANASVQTSLKKRILNYALSSRKENSKEQLLMPDRPSKGHRHFTPSVIHSKRKLEILPHEKKSLRRYCNGTRYLNIIIKLEAFPAILDNIFSNLPSKDLLNMSLVSKDWCRVVKSNKKVNTRIQHYLNEYHNVKENIKEPMKIHTERTERYPFGKFNILSTSDKSTSTSLLQSKFYENQHIVQQLCENERMVKCPRCGKGSIVSDSSQTLSINSVPQVPGETNKVESATIVQVQNVETNSIHSTSSHKIQSVETKSVSFGKCTSLVCKYVFCLKCLCDYHHGENCKISEPESPSKLIISRKKSNLKAKSRCKLSSKRQTLRRLCFS